jgi:hypothetical protein
MSQLGISSGTIPRIAFQGYTAADQGVMYFSDIQFLCSQAQQRTEKESSGVPGWGIGLIVLGVVLLLGGVVILFVIRWKAQSSSSAVNAEPYRAL